MKELSTEAAGRQGEMFRLLVQSVREYAIFLTDPDGIITTWNEGAQRIKGWKAEEVIGRHFRVLYLPEQRDTGLPEQNLRLAAEHGHHEEDGPRIRKDGTTFFAHVVITPIRDNAGNIAGFAKVTQDITEAKLTEERLRAREEEFRTAFELAAVGNVQVDAATGRIVRANRKFCELLGYSADELLGLTPRELTHPDDRDADWAAINRLLRGDTETYSREKRYLRKDGSVVWASVTASLIRAADGRPLRSIAVVQDLTDRRKAEEALRTSEKRLRRALTAARMVVWEYDPASERLSVLENAAQVFGLRPGEAISHGEQGFGLIHPEDEARHRPLVEKAIAECSGYHNRFRMIRRDTGAVQWMDEWAQAIPDASGKTRRLVGVLMDVTDRKQSEDALRQQHALTQAITDNASTAILTLDTQGRVTFMNPAAETMAGYCFDEAQGRILHELIHHTRPDGRPFPMAECTLGKSVLRSGQLHHHEDVFIRRDGTMFPVRCSATPIQENGFIRGIVLEVMDITEEKRAAEARRDGEERFRAIAEHSITGIAEVDLSGRMLFVNDRYCAILGRSREELLSGLRMQDVTHPDDLPHNLPLFERLIREGKPFMIEKRYIRSDGSFVWVNNSVSGVRGADGKVKSIVAVSVDVTDRKRAEDELRDANRRKDEFLAMLAHELRNPLAPIRTGLELMATSGPSGEIVETMQQQVVHLVRLVDDLLDVSRIIRGRVELRKESVDLAAVVKRAVETVRPQVDAKQQTLSVSLPSEPLQLHADPVRLTQIIGNLLHNASKYNDVGGTLSIAAVAEGEEAVVTVTDNGIGIEPDLLPRLFDLFTQAVQTIDRSQGGLGIGLTLVKNLVEMHGGTVTARSDGAGRGSEFTVRLPLLKQAGEQVSLPPATTSDAKHRILVVDDNVDAAKMLALLLEKREGHRVFLAHNGPAAMEAAAEHRPDVILLDIGLPMMDGYEVARRLRQKPEFERTLLVALTGYGTEEDRRKSLSAGCDEHLVKPPSLDSLQRILARAKPAGA